MIYTADTFIISALSRRTYRETGVFLAAPRKNSSGIGYPARFTRPEENDKIKRQKVIRTDIKESNTVSGSEIAPLWRLGMAETKIANIAYFIDIDSTSLYAKRILADSRQKIDLPLLILAERQTGGRGRGDHTWWSQEGAILFSLVAPWRSFGLTRSEPVEMSLRVADAVAGTVNETLVFERKNAPLAEKSAVVKPPNDVYVAGKKIAGILIESPTPNHVIVGIGINANNRSADAPEPLKSTITSLIDITGERIDRIDTVRRLINRLLPMN